MRQTTAAMVLPCALAGLPLAAQPGEAAPAAYRVEVVMREAGAGGAAQRRYAVATGGQGNAEFRLSEPVVYETAPAGDPLRRRFESTERSVLMNCEVRGLSEPGKARLILSLGILNAEPASRPGGAEGPPPGRPGTHIRVDAPVKLGTRTNVASIDDPVLPRRYDVDVTVSRMP